MTHTGPRDNPLRFWVEEFHLALATRWFGEGKGDHNFVGDINWVIGSLRSVVSTLMSRQYQR